MAFGKRAGVALAALMLAACQTLGLVKQYEYDERVELSLDGSAVVDISASIPALVALRGATLSVDPEARFDRQAFRRLYAGPGVIGPRGQRVPPAWPPIRACAARRERYRRSCRSSCRSRGRAIGSIGWSTSFDSCRKSVRAAQARRGRRGLDRQRADRVPGASSQPDQLPQLADLGSSAATSSSGNRRLRERLSGAPLRMEARMRDRVDSLPHALAVRRNIHRGDAGAGRRRLVGQSKGKERGACMNYFFIRREARGAALQPMRHVRRLGRSARASRVRVPAAARAAAGARARSGRRRTRRPPLELFRRDFGRSGIVAFGEVMDLDADADDRCGDERRNRRRARLPPRRCRPAHRRACDRSDVAAFGRGRLSRRRSRAARAAAGYSARDRVDDQRQPAVAVFLPAPRLFRLRVDPERRCKTVRKRQPASALAASRSATKSGWKRRWKRRPARSASSISAPCESRRRA